MNIINKLFGEKNPKNNVLKESSLNDDGSPKIRLDSGAAKVATFYSMPKRSIYLSIFTVLALAIFGYRYFVTITEPILEDQPQEQALLPKSTLPSQEQKNESMLSDARKLYDDKQLDESIKTYEKLLKSKPEDAQVLNDLGVIYLKQRKWAESEEQLKKSLALNPKCYTCLNNLGYLKTIQGEDEQAEEYLKKAIAMSQDYLDPYFNLGVLYEKNGDLANSANAYQEYLRRSPNLDSPFHKQLEQHVLSMRGK